MNKTIFGLSLILAFTAQADNSQQEKLQGFFNQARQKINAAKDKTVTLRGTSIQLRDAFNIGNGIHVNGETGKVTNFTFDSFELINPNFPDRNLNILVNAEDQKSKNSDSGIQALLNEACEAKGFEKAILSAQVDFPIDTERSDVTVFDQKSSDNRYKASSGIVYYDKQTDQLKTYP